MRKPSTYIACLFSALLLFPGCQKPNKSVIKNVVEPKVENYFLQNELEALNSAGLDIRIVDSSYFKIYLKSDPKKYILSTQIPGIGNEGDLSAQSSNVAKELGIELPKYLRDTNLIKRHFINLLEYIHNNKAAMCR